MFVVMIPFVNIYCFCGLVNVLCWDCVVCYLLGLMRVTLENSCNNDSYIQVISVWLLLWLMCGIYGGLFSGCFLLRVGVGFCSWHKCLYALAGFCMFYVGTLLLLRIVGSGWLGLVV